MTFAPTRQVYSDNAPAAQPTLFADQPRVATRPPEPPHERGIKAAPVRRFRRLAPNGPLSGPASKLLVNREWVTGFEACDFAGLTKGALDILVREGHVRLYSVEDVFPRYYRCDLDRVITDGRASEAEREAELRGARRGAA